MKIIRIAVIGAIAASLISILVASSYFDAQNPVKVNMSSVIEKLSIGASFQCSFISVDRLKQCTIMWQQPIPGSARDIWSLGADNILVLTRIELSDESQHARRYEETICIFDSRGNLLAQKPIGEYQVKDVYQSNDGSLVNILTENDHNIVNIVTDPIGSSFLQIGYHSVLMPSWDGDFLINISGRGTGKTSTLVIDAGGEERKVAAARLLSKDGQALETRIASDFHEDSKRVLQVFDGNELLFSGCDSSGLNCNLTLYNADNGNAIWAREVPPLTSLEAICLDPAHSRTYLLMNPAANERGVQSFVISKDDGGIVSEITGSATWNSIGSADRHFYSIFSESPPPEQRPRHTFVIKHTPEFEIKSYGVLCEYHTLHSMKLCEDFLFGCIENCSIDGAIIPYITAIFNMGTDAALNGINGIPSESTKPTVLEGRWHIRDITADEVQLIGQFNPGERNLTAITIQRSWLE